MLFHWVPGTSVKFHKFCTATAIIGEKLKLRSGFHLFDLFCGDADGAIERHAGAGEQGGEQVGLVALDAGQEPAGVEAAAAFAGDDEWEIVAPVLVAVL